MAVQYRQCDGLSHVTSLPIWQLEAIDWINDHFAGKPVPQGDSAIEPGNLLDPIPVP